MHVVVDLCAQNRVAHDGYIEAVTDVEIARANLS